MSGLPPPRRDGLAATIVLACGALAVALALLARRRMRGVTVFAHRGFAAVAPENTVRAVRDAGDRADAVEVDVRRCGSGELVCVHDDTLDRPTDATGRVDELAWEALSDARVADSDATVARLEDVLAAVPDGVLVNLELKERGLADDVLGAIEDRGAPVLLSSFDRKVLAEIRARSASVPLAYVCRSGVSEALATAAELDCVAVHPRADLTLRTAVVPRAHRRGLAVNAWTVDSRPEAMLLALVGVDGVFADRPVGR